jgi:hypothetical protein
VFVDQRRQPRLVPNRITFFAQFEREMMLERQLEGIAKAQAAGKYRGRKPIAMERQTEVRRLAATGMAKARIALELKIGEAPVYRILARDCEQAHPARTRLGPLSPSHSNHETAVAGNGGAGWPLRRSASTCDK